MWGEGNSFTALMQAMGYLFAFVVILVLALYATRLYGKKAGAMMKGKHIKIVETLSLGFDKRLLLVKVGNQYLLLSSDGKTLRLVSELDKDFQENLETEADADKSLSNPFDFGTIFSKYLKKESGKTKTSVSIGAEQTEKSERMSSVSSQGHINGDQRIHFKENLDRIRKMMDTKDKLEE